MWCGSWFRRSSRPGRKGSSNIRSTKWFIETMPPLPAPSKDMGNKAGIDMGYTFSFIVGHLPGHDLAKSLVGSTAAAVREIGFEEPTKPVAVVRTFWNQ